MIRRFLLLSLAAAGIAAAQTTPYYPGRLPTDSDLLVVTDDTEGVLAVAMTTQSMTITLIEAGKWVPNQAVTIDGEIIKICTVNGRTLGICVSGRSLNGGLPVSHKQGSAVKGNIIAAHHNNLKDLLIAITTALGPNLDNIVKHGGSLSPPAPCSAANRMTFWMRRGGAGIGDDLQMCAKDAQENYAWHSILGQ